jgi:hypothetical protein
MKLTYFVVVSALAGLCIGTLNLNRPSRKDSLAQVPPVAVASPEPKPTPSDSCVFLAEDNKFRVQLNGSKLPVSLADLELEDVSRATIKPAPRGELFLMLGNTLYRLNSQKEIVWTYKEFQVMFDFEFVPATDLIYGTAGDGVMFILDAATGKKLQRDEYNGKAAYGSVKAYKRDECLITSNYAGYREHWWEDLTADAIRNVPTAKDEITDYRGTKVLWSRDFPPDADLLVDGERILALTKTTKNIYVKEVPVPVKK